MEANQIALPLKLTKFTMDIEIEKFIKINGLQFYERAVEEICEAYGIFLLRLPPYHSNLNPIENVWSIMKQNIRKNCSVFDKLNGVVEMGNNALLAITPKMTLNIFNHITKEENWLRRDQTIIDPIIINLDNNDIYTSDSDSDKFAAVSLHSDSDINE